MAAARRGALVVHGAAAAGAVGQSARTAGRRPALLCGGAPWARAANFVKKPPLIVNVNYLELKGF